MRRVLEIFGFQLGELVRLDFGTTELHFTSKDFCPIPKSCLRLNRNPNLRISKTKSKMTEFLESREIGAGKFLFGITTTKIGEHF